MRYLRDTSYVEDVLQESFVKIFNQLVKYDPTKASLKSWTAKITINSALNYNRRVIGQPKEEIKIESHQTPIQTTYAMRPAKELLALLKAMPESYFEIFNLYIIDGLSLIHI